MKKITSKIKNVTAAFALVIFSVAPAFSVAAIEHPEDYAKIRLRGATNASAESGLKAFYNGGEVSITGAVDPAFESEEVDTDGDSVPDTTMYSLYTKSQSVTLTATPDQNMRTEARIDGQLINLTNDSYTYSDLKKSDEEPHGYEIEFSFVDDSQPPAPEGNLVAELHLSCADGSTNCFQDSGFAVNGGPVEGASSSITYRYNGDESDTTINLRAETLWHMKFDGSIFVNGVEYKVSDYINYDDRDSWFLHYENQVVYIELEVAKAANDVYEIVYSTAINTKQYIGNFLWSADPADKDDEDYIGNSTLALIAVEYTMNGIRRSCSIDTGECVEGTVDEGTGEFTPAAGCFIAGDDDCVKNTIPLVEYNPYEESGYEKGSLVLPAGARITMRIIPDYGYQVLNVNMSELVTSDDGIGEFTFTVEPGAAYFVADVIKTEDEVNADESEMVETGSIDLGDDQTSLYRGTARLTIEDLALSDDEKKAFAEQVGDDGYEMKTYLDISLYNIIYRGNTDSAWEDQVDDLNEEATITLQLSEDVDGNDIVIVHKKHDGTFEVIPTVYDPVAHTITFKTSSFSDYAIASRTVASPDTGAFTANSSASVAMSGLVTAQAFLTVFALSAFKKSYRK